MRIKAIGLQDGDEITATDRFPQSLYTGKVKNVVVVDRGVQVNLDPSGHYTLAEDEEVSVKDRPIPGFARPDIGYVGDDADMDD